MPVSRALIRQKVAILCFVHFVDEQMECAQLGSEIENERGCPWVGDDSMWDRCAAWTNRSILE